MHELADAGSAEGEEAASASRGRGWWAAHLEERAAEKRRRAKKIMAKRNDLSAQLSVVVAKDKFGRAMGFAEVFTRSAEAAREVQALLAGAEVGGRPLSVRLPLELDNDFELPRFEAAWLQSAGAQLAGSSGFSCASSNSSSQCSETLDSILADLGPDDSDVIDMRQQQERRP